MYYKVFKKVKYQYDTTNVESLQWNTAISLPKRVVIKEKSYFMLNRDMTALHSVKTKKK